MTTQRIALLAVCAAAGFLAAGCPQPPLPEGMIPAEGTYNVEIHRDKYGVPHIYGKTDVDVAYGLGFAHCEDDWDTLQEGLLLARGRLSEVQGREMAPFDFLVGWFRSQEIIEEAYYEQLSPEIRAMCEAFADACNHYAALNPGKVWLTDIFPATGKDVVAGFVIKTPLFFGLEREMRSLFEPTRQREVSEKQASARGGGMLTNGLPIGSNTFAVSPRRSANGETFLAINSHQPFTGPVAWYEARMRSEEGYDMTGGVFPGTPIILHGHNDHLGWAHTVNSPDLVDIYVLEVNPDNENQYLFDGEWRDFEVREVAIRVRVLGRLKWTVKREALYSIHGPALRTPHGTYAVRYAGHGDIRQVEQWYRMGKATNLDEFREAMEMRAIPSFNVGYADREGNIWYLYNALLPIRAEGYDWRQYLPGDTSETLWTEYLPFSELPQVLNPESGYVQNCNNTPFRSTSPAEDPREEDFSKTFGIETHMTNRGLRALELFEADDTITWEAFNAYKYDLEYSRDSDAARLGEKLLEQVDPEGDEVVERALEVLREWDYRTNKENTAAAVAILTMEPIVRAELFGRTPPDAFKLFREKAHLLNDTFGRVDVPWGDVCRLVRGDVNLPLNGGPDVLRAIYGSWDNERGHLVAEAGDCYFIMVAWDDEGNLLHSESIHQFGSATLDETSPHYADQAPLFATERTKPTWRDPADLAGNTIAVYRPGEAWSPAASSE